MAGLDLWTAQRWGRGGVPGWVPRGALVVGWVAAIVAGLGLDDDPCSAAEPSVCGPEVGWAVGAALLLATPILLVALPALGCLVGVLAGVVEQWDRVPEARTAFTLHGLACAAVLVAMLLARRRQASVARTGTGRLAVRGPPPSTGPGLFAPAALLLLAAAGGLLLWHGWTTADQRHLAAADRMDARVVAEVDDGWAVRLVLPDRQDEVELDVVGSYEVGDVVPVLVDRTGDRPWVALVAEQPDPTFPLSAGLAAALAGIALAGWEVRRRRVPSRLAGGAPARTVLALHLGDEVELWDTDGSGPFARVPIRRGPAAVHGHVESPVESPVEVDEDEDAWVGVADEYAARFGAGWRGEAVVEDDDADEDGPELVRMTAVGDLREGGWVALVRGPEVLWPLRTVRLLRRGTADPDEAEREDRLRGTPVAPGPLVDLPLAARPTDRTRLLGAAMLLGFAAGPLAATRLATDWYETGLALCLGGYAGLAGLDRLRSGLRVEPDRLVVRHRWRVHEVPWAALHGARRDGDELRLAWYPDETVDLGPLAIAAPTPTPGNTPAPGDTAAEVAQRVGAAVMRQREPARSTGGPVVVSRWSRVAVAAAVLYPVGALLPLLG